MTGEKDVRSTDDVTATYTEDESERVLEFEVHAGSATDNDGDRRTPSTRTAVIAQNVEGYAMLTVRSTRDGDELERYYGFDMALDHVGELLGIDPHSLPVPEAAADMGM